MQVCSCLPGIACALSLHGENPQPWCCIDLHRRHVHQHASRRSAQWSLCWIISWVLHLVEVGLSSQIAPPRTPWRGALGAW